MAGRRSNLAEQRTEKEESSKRLERAHRILDAAAELITRWGYKKTAVDDIARLAGVAKGTIYLHWKTREDLFITLLLRESLEATQDILERIDRDPTGITLASVIKHAIYVTLTRPLTRALFNQDAHVLGELLSQGNEALAALQHQKIAVGRLILDFFRAKGAMRTDLTLDQQLKVYMIQIMGTMTLGQYLPPELSTTPEELSDLLALMVHQTLEPPEPVSPEIQAELQVVWETYVGQIKTHLEESLRKELA